MTSEVREPFALDPIWAFTFERMRIDVVDDFDGATGTPRIQRQD